MHCLARISIVFLTTTACLLSQGVTLPNGDPDPTYAKLWAWYDASNGVNSSPTALPDGTALTNWDDRSPNARHLTRLHSLATRHPTAVDNPTSCGPAVQFDGDDFVWGSASGIGRATGDRTIFVVVNVGKADRGYVFDGTTGSGRSTLHTGQTATPGAWHIWFSDSTQTAPNGHLMVGPLVDVGRYQVHSLVLAAGKQEHFINLALANSATHPNVFNLGGLMLGARVNTALGLTGLISEVIIYEEALKTADRIAIESYLANRHPLGFVEEYGQGCSGSGGFTPTLSATRCVQIGKPFAIDIADALGGMPCAINFGLGRTQLPIGPCDLLVSQMVVAVGGATSGTGATPGSGSFTLPITLPPSALGLRLTAQSILLDPGSALGATVTNGIDINIL